MRRAILSQGNARPGLDVLTRRRVRHIARSSLVGALALGGAGWLGLRVSPRSRAPAVGIPRDRGSVDLPAGLPEPVARHFQAIGGERLPVIETAVAWGTARMRIGGVWLPARVTSAYIPGQSFVRHMAITWLGMPILQGVDSYRDGEGMLAIGPFVSRGPEIDQGENLALWGEGVFMPTMLVRGPRVRWEPVDAISARLWVPFGSERDVCVVRIDPHTGLIGELTAERYRSPGEPKQPWKVELANYRAFQGIAVPTRITVTWEREGRPWYVGTIDRVAYNVDVTSLFPGNLLPTSRVMAHI